MAKKMSKAEQSAYMRDYRRRREAHGGPLRQKRTKPPPADPDHGPLFERPAPAPESYEAARDRKARAEADIKELARDRESGAVIDRDRVDAALAVGLGAVRAALDALPRSVAALVPADDSPRVRAAVEEEVDRAVEGLRVALLDLEDQRNDQHRRGAA